MILLHMVYCTVPCTGTTVQLYRRYDRYCVYLYMCTGYSSATRVALLVLQYDIDLLTCDLLSSYVLHCYIFLLAPLPPRSSRLGPTLLLLLLPLLTTGTGRCRCRLGLGLLCSCRLAPRRGHRLLLRLRHGSRLRKGCIRLALLALVFQAPRRRQCRAHRHRAGGASRYEQIKWYVRCTIALIL